MQKWQKIFIISAMLALGAACSNKKTISNQDFTKRLADRNDTLMGEIFVAEQIGGKDWEDISQRLDLAKAGRLTQFHTELAKIQNYDRTRFTDLIDNWIKKNY